ncbi:Pentatricopeptide repeat-containing protein [Trichinella pseudospiralis]
MQNRSQDKRKTFDEGHFSICPWCRCRRPKKLMRILWEKQETKTEKTDWINITGREYADTWVVNDFERIEPLNCR